MVPTQKVKVVLGTGSAVMRGSSGAAAKGVYPAHLGGSPRVKGFQLLVSTPGSKPHPFRVSTRPQVQYCPKGQDLPHWMGAVTGFLQVPPPPYFTSLDAQRNHETVTATEGGALAGATHQRKVVGVDPQDAQVGVVGIVPGNLFQDLQEFVAI